MRRGAASVEASAELRADSAARGRTWQRLLRTALGGEGGAAARRLSLRFDGGDRRALERPLWLGAGVSTYVARWRGLFGGRPAAKV